MSNYAFDSSRSMLLLFFLAGFALPATAAPDARVSQSYGKLPLRFEANQGQTGKDVQFVSRGAGYGLYLTANEAVLVLAKPNLDAKREGPAQARPDAKAPAKAVALRMSLVGAARKPLVKGVDEFPGKANYFIDNNPARWRSHVPTYAKVHYRGIYPGIDLVYYGNQRQLEHDFVVAPGANPRRIVLDFQGAEKLEIDAGGDLLLHTAAGTVRQSRPVIYQEIDGVRREIDGGYVLKGANRVGFRLTPYDRSRQLIIDPVLSYSTYLGGGAGDFGNAIAVDAAGNAYVAGNAPSSDFPTTAGAFQPTGRGGAFVTKLDPTGSALVYSTYLNVNGGGEGHGVAVDTDGNAYLTGGGFVAKLDPTGAVLIYSILFNGSGNGIALDADRSAYVTGVAGPNFSTTIGAFQTTFAGDQDAFVMKIDPTGSAPVYATYLGGNTYDWGFGIAVDSGGNAYVAGMTFSANFPTTAGAFQPAASGGAFVTKLNPSGSALVYSTYLGVGGSANGIAVDAAGSAYVTGAAGQNFPTTAGAFQTTFGGRLAFGGDAFVTKLDPSGSALVYSTYLGGSGTDVGKSIAVDAVGNAYVTGSTNLPSFPTTPDAFQRCCGGGFNGSGAFFTKLNPTGSALVYSTFIDGNDFDAGLGIAVDPNGNVYITGSSNSTNFPTTAGSFQPGLAGVVCCHRPPADAFVVKFIEDSTAPNTTAASSPAANAAGWNNSPVTVTLSATDNGGGSGVKSITYSVNAGAPVTVNGATASFTLSADGAYTVSFNATDNAGNPEASRTLVVRIDQTPPSGTLSLSPSQLWPPNHKLVTITPSLAVSDAGGGAVSVSGPIVSSSEPVTGGDDVTSPDWVVSGNTLQLRAERAESSSGRVYTVSYTLTDQAGNSAQASSTVTVPKNR
jgi:hypothetical protein